MTRYFFKDILTVFVCMLVMGILSGCSSCRREIEPEMTITGRPVTLHVEEEEKSVAVKEEGESNVLRIEVGPSKEKSWPEDISDAEAEEVKSSGEKSLPPDTYEETDLTARLQDKLLDAYGGNEDAVPDVKIYISEMGYDEFVRYYQNLGYSVHTVAIPASQVIEPVLDQRAELVGKIDLSNYEGVVIHQVMIDEVGISAADKYIDPDTFEVVEKTFVTKMNK